ncbi:plasmid mobilization protein [Gaoshiqia sediminis]|uniref:MobC family plasmid mobilization relaxosome protein n=1 Tax=Gaoshiqia sediminis TaxID=2986998 RepID=A0AA41Y4H2_9BACT|nr:plasmid mobilization relaxosome protein MobC [Gaoshiqia sediminis]MCW0481361.1 MobC family plasmid mobilization relaxosome protein [Gaoshiqia sediminis]
MKNNRSRKESMRPHLPDKEKRNEMLIIRITREEKIRLKSLTKRGKFACMSDYIRSRVFKQSDRKVISLDEEANILFKSLDYELNKIGVNLNQLSKRMNSFSGYRVDDNDRQLLKQAFEMMRQCLILLQKYLR